jgi:cell division protein FtsA
MSADAAVMGWRRVVAARPAVRATPLAVLDLGTSKLCCFIARARTGRGFAVIGRGYQLADGFRAGDIVDAEAADASIRAVLHEAEEQAGERLREIVVTLSGGRPRSNHIRVSTDLAGRAVTEDDLRLLMRQAHDRVDGERRSVVHVLPLEVTIDGGRPLLDARGMSGRQLEMLAHVVSLRSEALRDVLAALERSHVVVKGVAVASYAAGVGCLTVDELDRGCLALDMGGGTTSIALFAGGRLALVDQVPYGGEHVTGDLAFGLSTSRSHAERIKNLYGSVLWRACDDNQRIPVPLIGDDAHQPTGEVPRTRLTQIARARVEEIFGIVQQRLAEAGELIAACPPRSIVLTGGASEIEGVVDLAQEQFGLPARLGRPDVDCGIGADMGPCCASVSGALALAAGDDRGLRWSDTRATGALLRRVLRLRQWISENF